MGPAVLFSVFISPWLELPAIISHVSTSRSSLIFVDVWYFASALETNDNRPAANFADIITIGVGALIQICALYKLIFQPSIVISCMFRQSVAVLQESCLYTTYEKSYSFLKRPCLSGPTQRPVLWAPATLCE